ncbi:uncharacterized protein LACBIDRAFT_299684 [Laccaria bicolor S238N-H82]|uniref:Predicted protein n=1 Tax=Laccaria bicolor (strain S238N-H82 / ATCC MYA-4686) TaxID=486041 RepID=B0DF63_LACBS|nr:uncharacterized protein LACBIDRAFT_299684 [Laccaria bicolor S238N-H82]EDR06659.1 predicted protein [Laccaria bicolor S238N-H82]|eukprot:XP_001882506.1 predicted protein [Laccaria bicolor S238N-H82]
MSTVFFRVLENTMSWMSLCSSIDTHPEYSTPRPRSAVALTATLSSPSQPSSTTSTLFFNFRKTLSRGCGYLEV